MNKFHIYINFPNNVDKIISNEDEGRKFLKEFQMTIDRADCERGTTLYYGTTNKELFLENLRALEGEDMLGNFGLYSFEDALNILLSDDNIKEWENNSIQANQDDRCYYKLWISESRNAISDYPAIFNEIVERELRISDKTIEKQLLLNFFNIDFHNKPIVIIRDCSGSKPIMLYIDFVIKFIELDKWFKNERMKREYNFEDNRHIEKHPDYRKRGKERNSIGKSPIIGGIGGKNRLSLLLDDAIGDGKENSYLINIDTEKKCYVRFEDENVNLYHGYNLVKPISHEIDEAEERKIPQRIKDLLNYRKLHGE